MVDLHLLGAVEVVDSAGHSLKLGGARQRGLLALLALRAPRMVGTDAIIEALWGEADVARPEAALHMAVNRLRAAIGEELIVTESGGYRLDIPTANSDVSRFRALVQRGIQLQTLGHPTKACESFRHGLAQWRGTALADLEFDFAEHEARLLEDERLLAVEHLMESMLAAGEHELVIGELFGLVQAFPLRERIWHLLMLALYRSGRQAEALAAFKDLRTTLGEELGIEPALELVDLEERILLHDPSLTDFELAAGELGYEVDYVSFAPGDVIVEQGVLASSVYWIEEGLVEILMVDGSGATQRLTELGAGRYFGELAATLGTRRTATVRALIPTTVSVHDTRSFRIRLGLEREKSPDEGGAVEELWDLVRRGEYLIAFDRAAGLIEVGDAAPEVRYLAVLALARSGATAQARRRYEQYGLGTIDPGTLKPQLAGDIAVLSARLDKDEALSRSDPVERAKWAERSAKGYSAAYDGSGLAYHAANAATMWLVSGDREQAVDLASRALQEGLGQGDEYWDAATEAEAAIIGGDLERARVALDLAGGSPGSLLAARATTLKQLKLVCGLEGLDVEILDPIRNPGVVHYCGHRILPAGAMGRFSAEEESRVRSELDRIFSELDAQVGFGSLAAGADILAAEALLNRGAQLNVMLPFSRDEFVRTSVIQAGAGWVDRFDKCLARADTVEIASSGEYLDDPIMFDFCARIAMGDALLRARFLETEPHQVAVWDGTPSAGVAGTAVDVRSWSATGAPSTVIPVRAGETSSGSARPDHERKVRAIIFADFAGFSKLTDAQRVAFQEHVMNPLSARIEPYRAELLAGNTWGDAIHLVFGDVSGAAECALDLVAAVDAMDMEKAGLPQLRGLRIAAHAAPVFEGWDPITGSHLFYGAGLTQAARIEPRTPEGEIYTTHAFAALVMLSGVQTFECQYVGTLPTAKQFGNMPLYALRRKASFFVR